MNRQPVSSSMISEVGYANGVLEIQFKRGDVYHYLVPQDIYEGMMKAPSMGKFFHNFIEPHYQAQKIVEAIKE